jgi:transcriptional regulator with XRE-family HTH domain
MPAASAPHDYAALAAELVRALRGRRSCAQLSRRAGYRSNMVQRWEAQQCWPTAAAFAALHARLNPREPSWLARFFHGQPAWLGGLDPCSPAAVAAFLRQLKGKTAVVRIAELAGKNRYSVARWFDGRAQPKLPELLLLVDVTARRLPDLAASFVDPERVPALRAQWSRLTLARNAAYDRPWSHAVLRALEVQGSRRKLSEQPGWIAERLGIPIEDVRAALSLLQATGQVQRTRKGLAPLPAMVVDTSHDPERAHTLKVAWTATALDRLRARADGSFGYSLFSVSRADLARLQALHLEYVREMQRVIAASTPNEVVGLYCSQLLALGPADD